VFTPVLDGGHEEVSPLPPVSGQLSKNAPQVLM
jgi:hypothetical protein